MIQLLIIDPNAGDGASGDTRFGGKPSANRGRLVWPSCATCSGNMQFLGQIRENESGEPRLLLLFMCQNEPGLCDEWDANGGGNRVITVAAEDLQLVDPPYGGNTLRETRYGGTVALIESEDYNEARTKWAALHDVSLRQILGQLAGSPSWIQSAEIPICDLCDKPMQFVVQLEQGPDRKTDMNFGGDGCAYVFECRCSGRTAKMLWQS